MKAFALVASLAMLLSVPAANAQQPAAPAASAAQAEHMMKDCAKPKAKHDHGAEKGTPTPMKAMPCEASADAASVPARAKKKPTHDHSKVHKTM